MRDLTKSGWSLGPEFDPVSNTTWGRGPLDLTNPVVAEYFVDTVAAEVAAEEHAAGAFLDNADDAHVCSGENENAQSTHIANASQLWLPTATADRSSCSCSKTRARVVL